MSSLSCDEVTDIHGRVLAGDKVSEIELQARDEHLSRCEDCRLFVSGLQLLSRRHGAHFPVKPAHKERLIAGALQGLEQRRRSRRSPWPLAAAACAAAALLMAGAALSLRVFWSRSPATATSLAPSGGQLLLVAGGAPGSLAAGQPLRASEVLKSADGRLALSLGRSIKLLLEPGTTALLTESPARAVLALEHGGVFGLVDPHGEGRQLSIITSSAEVEIVGTAFRVAAEGGGTALEVFHGRVRTRPRGRPPRLVSGGQRALLDGTAPRAMTEAELGAGQRLEREVQVLASSAAGRLEVDTRPRGLRVSVDGERLGETPLSAKLKARPSLLEVYSGERRLLAEMIQIKEHQTVRRSFDLTVAEAARSPSTNVTAPASAPSTREVAVLEPVRSARHGRTHRPPPPSSRRPDPAAVIARELERARLLRSEKKWNEAAQVYAQLLAREPNAAAAQPAWISLATLDLDYLGAPRAALHCCDRYVRQNPRGVLLMEAMVCMAEAWRRMGQTLEEQAAIERFLARFPAGPHAERLQRRLSELKAKR